MRRLLFFCAVVLMAACALGADAVSWTLSTGTNTAATGYSESFVGEIDEVAVYASAGATGAVSVMAIDPYSGNALVLATNAAAVGYVAWSPRVAEAAMTGATARSITNAPTADRFRAQGEALYATVSGSRTNATFRFRLKLR